MTKRILISRICSKSSYDPCELNDYSKEELELLLEDIEDISTLYPNGRDTDAEDED